MPRNRKTAVLKRKLESRPASSATPNRRPTQSSVNPDVTAEGKGHTFNSPKAGVSIKNNKIAATGKSKPADSALNLFISSYQVSREIEATEKHFKNRKGPATNSHRAFLIYQTGITSGLVKLTD